ncbi:MerR family transcriptional regulator [Rhodocytophaga rosea]|uniref:MerR family transcriptional regulator n=1 Tax=Rhodocytophaga rosea TaxID=2704465 RepID=A0A6C0GSK6_9BACT|nr:MerR family transcriptional regulator [Rhodocytophaga rosea]QHT71089.1 MerR family transcriptional regulator [Rhodocytophaga rosea]
MKNYSVKQLSRLAGVSIRTLHLYDQMGLLKPAIRTEARYRLYGEKQLLRLQQILFYKEMDFSLEEIGHILDKPDFDMLQAMEHHKTALQYRYDRLYTLLQTVDKTISHLKGTIMLTPEELYEGLPKDKAEAYRKEAIAEYGESTVARSENYLRQLSKQDFAKLKAENQQIAKTLFSMLQEDPASDKVQQQIKRHYAIIRTFWGTANSPDPQADAYAGLGQLYVSDERFTMAEGIPQPEYALFMSKAMRHFADTQLK